MDLNDQSQPLEEVERTSAQSGAFAPNPAPEKPKKSKVPLVLGTLLVLALVGCGVLGWMSYDLSNQKASLQTKAEAKDEKIAVLESQLKSAKAALKENSNASDDTTTDTSSSTNDTLIKLALAYSKAKVTGHGYPDNATDLEGTIDKQTSTFTRVQVGSPTAGPGVDHIYFKKVKSDWVFIGSETGELMTFHQIFGMPNDF